MMIEVKCVAVDGEDENSQYLIDCNQCGAVSVVENDQIESAAVEHMAFHGVPIEPFLEQLGEP